MVAAIIPQKHYSASNAVLGSRTSMHESVHAKFKQQTKVVMNNIFQDKVVLITGATSGIGEHVAHELATRRAKIVVSGRRKVEGQAVVRSIQESGGIATFFQADASREADVKSLVDLALKNYGRLDFAFNNAGVEGTTGRATDQQTEENYRHTFDVNVLGVLLSMKYEIPAILKNGGAIVNTSSVVGQIGLPMMGVYSASKHAVNGLTRTVSKLF